MHEQKRDTKNQLDLVIEISYSNLIEETLRKNTKYRNLEVFKNYLLQIRDLIWQRRYANRVSFAWKKERHKKTIESIIGFEKREYKIMVILKLENEPVKKKKKRINEYELKIDYG